MKADMDRGVIVGGGLIAASFLVAVLLNRSAHNEAPPVKAQQELPVPACEHVVKGPPGVSWLPDPIRDDCERPQPSPLKR
jgi:hypothetical protein